MGIRLKRCLVFFCAALPALAFGQQPVDTFAAVRTQLAAGQYKEAEAMLSRYIQTTPDSAQAHFLLGYDYFREQRPTESLAEFTLGAKFERPSSADLKIVASDYVLLHAYADADKWLTEVVRETPADADAWYLLGRAKYNENDIAGAAPMFEHALALHPQYIEAENNLGLCLKELNGPIEARTAFQKAIDWQGNTPSDAQPFLNLGSLLAEQGAWEDATHQLSIAAKLAPENPKIHEELGDIYTAQQKLPDAQRAYERAITLAPDIAALHFKLGKVLRKQGQNDLAQAQFAICSRLNGTQSSKTTPNPATTQVAKPAQAPE